MPSDPDSKPVNQMPRRWSIGLNVAVQIILVLALFFGANRLSYRYHTRWDLSPQKNFTLSSATLNYLDKLSKDVFIANVIPRDGQLFGETQTLLEEYRINGRGRVKVRSIDPVRDVERAEALKAETGLALDQSGIVVRCSKRTRFITEEELVIREQGTETQRAIKEYRGEDAITSALINVVEGDERKFYFVVGKGARTEAAMVESMLAIGELGRQQNFQLFPLNLAEVSNVPADADGVILGGLRYDLSEREMDIIKAYWTRQRSGLLVMLDPSGETPRLNAFLGLHGVVPRGDRVLYAESTGSGTRKEFSVQAIFDVESSITRPLATTGTTLPGQTESLEVRFEDEYLKNKNIVVHPLMGAPDRYWGERSALAYAWRTQLEHGARLAFGSDAPVESPNPFWGLHAAVTRRRPDGAPAPEGWYPEQKLTLSEALAAYTRGAAYAANAEHRLGMLAPGFLADLIVLEQDPFTCPPDELLAMQPSATMVGGEWVWQSEVS